MRANWAQAYARRRARASVKPSLPRTNSPSLRAARRPRCRLDQARPDIGHALIGTGNGARISVEQADRDLAVSRRAAVAGDAAASLATRESDVYIDIT